MKESLALLHERSRSNPSAHRMINRLAAQSESLVQRQPIAAQARISVGAIEVRAPVVRIERRNGIENVLDAGLYRYILQYAITRGRRFAKFVTEEDVVVDLAGNLRTALRQDILSISTLVVLTIRTIIINGPTQR